MATQILDFVVAILDILATGRYGLKQKLDGENKPDEIGGASSGSNSFISLIKPLLPKIKDFPQNPGKKL